MDGSRDEVVGQAERLIRRGELGEAVALLQAWTRANPADAAARTRLDAVRSLAEAEGAVIPPMPKLTPEPARTVAEAPRERPLPEEPVARLQELLARVKRNKR